MFKKEELQAIKIWVLLGLILSVFILIIIKIDFFLGFFQLLLRVLQPLFIGISLAFVLNILSSRLESILKKDEIKSKFLQKLIRPLAITLAFSILVVILYFLLDNVIPQLLSSLSTLITRLPDYLITLQNYLNELLTAIDPVFQIELLDSSLWLDFLPHLPVLVSDNLANVVDTFLTFTGVFLNIFFGIVISIYFLLEKESFLRQIKKTIYALFTPKTAKKILLVSQRANQIYSGFISGQLLRSLILGVSFYIILSLLQMPYALLVSCFTALLSFIPIAGTAITWIIGTLLILAIDPVKGLLFLVIYQVLQQLDSVLLYPRIVGKSIGLPGVWTLLAVFVGGGLFGVLGIILGVPTIAVIYSLFVDHVNLRLSEKKLLVSDLETKEE